VLTLAKMVKARPRTVATAAKMPKRGPYCWITFDEGVSWDGFPGTAYAALVANKQQSRLTIGSRQSRTFRGGSLP